VAEAIITTARLNLFHVTEADADFIYRLVNEPTWLKYIGDRKVYSPEGAKAYIKKSFTDHYAKNGFGLYMVCLKDGTPIGLSGLINRDSLEDIDIGFAQFPEYAGKGYAFEAAKAVLDYGKNELNLEYVVAITSADNFRSQDLLTKLGFRFDKYVPYVPGDVSMLFSSQKA